MTDQAPAQYAGPKRVLSGVQSSGDLHLGNYLGALVKFVRLQHEADTFIFVADMHAITVWQDPKTLKSKVREITAAYLASGLDPKIATSLYGRGLAKRRLGDATGAARDIAAAKAIDPKVADLFNDHGITR